MDLRTQSILFPYTVKTGRFYNREEVRAGSLNRIQANSLKVSRRPLTAKASDRSRASPCEICDGQVANGGVFSPGIPVYSSQYHSTKTSHCLHLHVALTSRTNGQSLATFRQGMLNRRSGNIGQGSAVTSIVSSCPHSHQRGRPQDSIQYTD